MVEMMALKLVA
jgi:hypothetical protein